MNLPCRLADALNQRTNRFKKLVEPAGQLRGFILPTYFQSRSQIALALGNAFESAGDTTNRLDHQSGEPRAGHCKQQCANHSDSADQPGQTSRPGHHFARLDQADKPPAQRLRRPDQRHVILAGQLHLHQAFARLGQLLITVAEIAEFLEVVRRIARVHQHGVVGFHQHQITALAEADLLDQVGQLLERYIDVDHASIAAQLVVEAAHSAHQHHVIRRPVIGLGAQGFAGVGHRGFVPGPGARIVVRQLRIARPEQITALLGADR